MEYTVGKIDEIKLTGKQFEISTSDIKTADYQDMYMQVCKGESPTNSYGIYEIKGDMTLFSIITDSNKYSDTYVVLEGHYYEFEIDMAKNKIQNQYQLCYDQLINDNAMFSSTYAFELMDNNMMNTGVYKYYIKKENNEI